MAAGAIAYCHAGEGEVDDVEHLGEGPRLATGSFPEWFEESGGEGRDGETRTIENSTRKSTMSSFRALSRRLTTRATTKRRARAVITEDTMMVMGPLSPVDRILARWSECPAVLRSLSGICPIHSWLRRATPGGRDDETGLVLFEWRAVGRAYGVTWS